MTRGQKFQDVIDQALSDPGFAATLGAAALAAQDSGVGSEKWIALVNPFARNAQDLAELTTLTSESGSCTVPTSFLLQTVSTVQCTMTTTNTTTSYFCPEPKGSSKSRQKRKSKKG